MTAGTTSRTAHLLALMKKGDDVVRVSRGTAGDQSPARAPGALVAAAVPFPGCRRGSSNLRDASSPGQARSPGKGHSAAEHKGDRPAKSSW